MLDNKSQIWYNIGVNKTRKVTQMYCKRLSRNNCSRVDFFNENRIRNIQNTYLRSYNCGGYAFNTFSWYCPHYSSRKYGSTTEQGMLNTTNNAVAFMLKEFKDLRVITDLKELQPNEYAIAFRIGGVGGEDDFHFMKRGKNGKWYHKTGELDIQFITKEKVFADKWVATTWAGTCTYCGKLILFAKKF